MPRLLLLIVPTLLLGLAAPLTGASDDRAMLILGNWLTETRDGIIQISMAPDGSYQGKIVGGNNPQRQDQHNPDPAR